MTTLQDIVEQTPFVDTHEHLVEEERRTAGRLHEGLFPCDDWAYLFYHYLGDDLLSAGMPGEDRHRFYAPETSSDAKFRLIAPWWERVKHTGYGQAVRHTLQGLYGEDDLTADSAPRIADRYHALVKPGFYRDVLCGSANVQRCHVNSLERIFMETAQPDLLQQDLSILSLHMADTGTVERESGRTARTLEEWLAVVDGYFAACGSRAVAVKSQAAYGRRLDYADVPAERAAPVFTRLARGEAVSPGERKDLEDFLFRYCVRRATAHGLPVKLHTGYYAGTGGMPLDRVRRNPADLCGLLQDFPDTTFVLMHIGYPYQDEMIALAKHYRNAYVDMCWAWIINPAASARFLKEYLLAAPANKLFTFGGDYMTVECVYGHARVARQGIAQALTEMIAEGWLRREEAPALAERIMRGNAVEVFPAPARSSGTADGGSAVFSESR